MKNIEVKLRVEDHAPIVRALRQLGAVDDAILQQRDVYFHCTQGRLKLRFENDAPAQLIAYRRADTAALRASHYEIYSTAHGEALLETLARSLGIRIEVRKRRHLYLLDNVRIHLDEVENLGRYIELEAVVDANHTEAQCDAQARALLQHLQLTDAAIETVSYADLVAPRRS